MSSSEELERVRRGAGLFRLTRRGVIQVDGGDRVRWLDGMVSNDVKRAAQQGPGSGCYALLLTPQGRVVADLHVLVRDGCFWLETEGGALPDAMARLERHVIADDVTLTDRSGEFARLAVEGPAAPSVLEALLGTAPAPPSDAWTQVELRGVGLVVAGFALAGGPGFQLFAPAGSEGEVHAGLLDRGRSHGLVPAGLGALDVLRIEAGIPWLGRDLDESVLPDEARLERAVSTTKGCYAGQEVVARMRSRGRLSHRLAGLRCDGEQALAVGADLTVAGERVGEVTSSAVSPRLGAIALGYLRCPHDAPGTLVRAGEVAARVVELPFAEGG